MQTNLFKLKDLNVVIEIIVSSDFNKEKKKSILTFRKNYPAQVGTKHVSITQYPSLAQRATSDFLSVSV